jgi:hypothetical protein
MTMRALLVLAAVLPQETYLPLKDGAHWTYLVEELGAAATAPAQEVVAEVGGAPPSADPDWMAVSNYLGYRACWLRATAAGVDLKIEARAEAPVLTIFKASAKTGETWTGSLGKEALTFTMRGEETLERGETRIQALHVEFTASAEKHAGHAPTRGDVWFAAGLGIVKAQLTTDLDCHTAMTKVYQLKP